MCTAMTRGRQRVACACAHSLSVDVLSCILNATAHNKNPKRYAPVCSAWMHATQHCRNWKFNAKPRLYGFWMHNLIWEWQSGGNVHRYSFSLLRNVVCVRSASECSVDIDIMQHAVHELVRDVWCIDVTLNPLMLQISLHPGKLRTGCHAPGTVLHVPISARMRTHEVGSSHKK